MMVACRTGRVGPGITRPSIVSRSESFRQPLVAAYGLAGASRLDSTSKSSRPLSGLGIVAL